MSSGPENRFIQGVHAKLPARVYRMKNHNPYNSGIADCWYSGTSGDLWVEYKFVKIPKRASTIVDLVSGDDPPLTRLQQEWLKSRHGEGRSVGVIIGTEDGGIWLPGVTFQKPLSAADIRANLRDKRTLAAMITASVS